MVSNAIKELEKEKQEKEIAKIKDIVRAILEKVEEKEKEVKAKQEELRALKADLDDLKAGRLDKIEERQGKDPVHDKVTIVKICRVEAGYVPMQPWRSWWEINSQTSSSQGEAWSGVWTTGTTCQNFTGGTYTLGSGQIINL